MKMKKALILTQWYLPEKTPRAFRAFELVQELSCRGYQIDLYAPMGSWINSANHNVVLYEVEKNQSGTNNVHVEVESEFKHIVKQYLKNFYLYLMGDYPKDIVYACHMLHALLKNAKNIEYDAAVSICLPFPVVVVLAAFSLVNRKLKIKVADFGDPYYYNPNIPRAIYFKWIEKLVLKRIDYITIPIASARKCYIPFKSEENIKIIPQGYKIIDVDTHLYKRNAVPIFCYAGLFYETIRNPKYFLEYLTVLKEEFSFVVYALPDRFTQHMLKVYKDRLGERLTIKEPLDREVLIHEMAKMDFVINFDNDNATQRPSKLVDYAMSHRPILSFNRETFRPEVFQAFLKGDYREQYYVDLEQYDIRRVVDQFEALFEEKIGKEVQ